MNLCIDIGNSRVKLALFQKDELKHHQIVKKLSSSVIRQLFDEYTIPHTILSSVRAENPDLIKQLKSKTSLLIFSHHTELAFNNLYETPKTLGKDRLAAAAGAHYMFPKKKVLVIDAGTCIKFDFINTLGNYLGGSISPGLQMRFEALHNFTAQLPLLKPEEMKGFIGKNTNESIVSGVQEGILAEVEGRIEQYKNKFGELVPLITGGNSTFFEKRLKNEIFAVPNLVLIGLNQILRFNVSKHP